ncbi:MAG: hypothetical protein ACK4UJ_09180 [Leptonema sp. (in: bacteria)]
MENTILEEFKNLDFIGISNGTCNYLQDRKQFLYYFYKENLLSKEYRQLLDKGFRRSGNYIYRPFCNFCNECQIIRIPVFEFKKSKSQKRVWNRIQNFGFDFKIIQPTFSYEKLWMYIHYLKRIHISTFLSLNKQDKTQDKPLDDTKTNINTYPIFYPNSFYENYKEIFLNTCLEKDKTKELNIFIKNKLVGVGILDLVEDAYSSVYFFYDPDFYDYSLGTFSILLEIEIAKLYNLKYYYLGYYIKDCSKMNYKINFKPCEIKRIQEKKFHTFVK